LSLEAIEIIRDVSVLKERKANVFFDVDGTLADIHSEVISFVNMLYKTKYELNDITDWNFTGCWKKYVDEEYSFLKEKRKYAYFNKDYEESAKGMTLFFVDHVYYGWEKFWKNVMPMECGLANVLEGLEFDVVTANVNSENIKNWLGLQGLKPKNFAQVPVGLDKMSLGYLVVFEDNPNELKNRREGQHLFFKKRPWNEKPVDEYLKAGGENVYLFNSFSRVVSKAFNFLE